MLPDSDTFITCSGEAVRPLFELGLDDDGKKTLVHTGDIDVPQFINAFASTTDMAYILARLSAGDASVLNRKPIFYVDSTVFPQNARDGYHLVDDAVRAFDALPDEVKLRFNNNALDWINSAGSDNWIANMTRKTVPDAHASAETQKEGD